MRSPLPPTRRRWKFRHYLLLALAILILLGIMAVYLLNRIPTWYQPMHLTDTNVDLVAEAAQERLVEFGNRVQNAPMANGVWTITQDQINALIAVRFAETRSSTRMAGRGPEGGTSINEITDPMVIFSPNVIRLAARTPILPGGGKVGGVGSLTLTVITLPPDVRPGAGRRMSGNQLGIKVTGVSINSLPLPNWVIQQKLDETIPKLSASIRQLLVSNIGNRADHYMPAINQWLDHAKRGEPFTPLLVTEGDRPFAIKNIQVDEGILTIEVGPP